MLAFGGEMSRDLLNISSYSHRLWPDPGRLDAICFSHLIEMASVAVGLATWIY
jgi:hypothetical protein